MEIGFNWGYSASLILESALGCNLRSIDIARHWYTKPAGELINIAYPGRFSSVWLPSTEALLCEIETKNTYDAIIVDGAHDYPTASSDIVLCLKLLRDGGLLIIDDTDAPSVSAAILVTVENHPEMVELTAENFSLYEFKESATVCFQQRYFLKRTPVFRKTFLSAKR